MKHGTRVGIERDRRCVRIYRLAALNDRLHDLLVTEMQTIKNAQRQYRRAKDIRVLSAVEYFHWLQTV